MFTSERNVVSMQMNVNVLKLLMVIIIPNVKMPLFRRVL